MNENTTTELTEMDRDRALEFTRHYDNLLWTVTSLLLPANAGLLAFAAENPSEQIGVLGVLLSVITVFFAASFRVLRLRLHARLGRDASRDDSWLYAGAAGWAGQWKIYVGLFAVLSLLWVSLLWTHFPSWRPWWVALLVAALVALWWLYVPARRHTPSNTAGSYGRASRMLNALKMLGLLIGLVGIVLALLDLKGYFLDGDRIALRDEIRDSSGGLSQTTRGFAKFLKAFPPPPGVDSRQVTHVVKDVIQTHDEFPVSITVRYLASGQRTRPVAGFADVERWAAETRFGWLSWIVAALGWLLVAGAELYEMFQKNPAG